MKRPSTTISYLEMYEAPKGTMPTLDVLVARPFPAWYFLALYKAVGEKYYWTDMLDLPPEELQSFCRDPSHSLYTLVNQGAPAGFFVLQEAGEVSELVYFGLTADALGQGLGGAWLDFSIATAWARKGLKTLKVNTCTLDHPRALSLYLSRGFVLVSKEERMARL